MLYLGYFFEFYSRGGEKELGVFIREERIVSRNELPRYITMSISTADKADLGLVLVRIYFHTSAYACTRERGGERGKNRNEARPIV